MATAAAAKKYGAVYVFNVYQQDVSVSLNGGLAQGTGAIPGWTTTGTGLKYQPQGLKVDRVLNKSDGLGQFWGPADARPGINQVVLNWGDGAFYATVTINKATNADLLLFIYRDKWTLVNVDDGTVIASGDVTSDVALKAFVRLGQSAASHGNK